MSMILIAVLLGVIQWSNGHVVYTKEHPRLTRHNLDEWRPVREDPNFGRHVPHGLRYPLYHKGHYNLAPPNKKVPLRQVGEHSEKVEVFSAAPPSILGSFSVFGHATVNAREHASHITKKSPRPQTELQQETRPGIGSFVLRQHHHQLGDAQKQQPQRFPGFEEHNIFYEASLRPPPRDHAGNPALNLVPHPHSTSLSPNTFYFEPPQPFQAPNSELGNGFHKLRKPIHKPHSPFRNGGNPQLFPGAGGLDHFKLSTQTPSHFETATLSFYDHGPKVQGLHGSHSYFNRNPFGDIRLSTRRPEGGIKQLNDGHANKDLFQQFGTLGQPFQNFPKFPSTPSANKDLQNYRPYVTTFSSASLGNNLKYPGLPQSFQIPSTFEHTAVSSVAPEFLVTQQPFTQDVFPITLTTLDLPTEQVQETEKLNKETYTVQPAPSKNGKPRRPTYHKNTQTSFLPTPSTDTETYINEPANEEETTQSPIIEQTYKRVKQPVQEQATENVADYVTTTEATEVTTRYTSPTKPRRRPTRPSETKTSDVDSNFKNHRLPTESGQNVDIQKNQRRRKPHTPYINRGNKIRYSEKRQRTTTTTTTPEPEVFEATQSINNNYNTVTAPDETTTISHMYDTDVLIDDNKSEYNSEVLHFADKLPMNEVRPHEDQYNSYYEEVPTTVPAPTTTTTMPTTTTTTTQTTTTEPTTTSISNRLKNKYGNSNRPRFSVKDYRERLNKATSTTTSPPQTEETENTKTAVKEPSESSVRFPVRNRGSLQYRGESNSTDGSSEPKRKYKPRIGPSRYKTSTTPAPTETTTERVNTFRPSTNRYKPGTGKYYSRYRTSTAQPKEAEETSSTTAKTLTRPKGVFSAKRRPFPLKAKPEKNNGTSGSEDNHRINTFPRYTDTLKTVENEVFPVTILTKKSDNVATTTMSSGEDSSLSDISMPLLDPLSDPTGAEAIRVADLTSSSSNDFESSGFLKGVSPSSRRTIPKITIATDDPILPLEAFFQTQNNKEK